MKKIKLEIVSISYSQTQKGACALVLSEENGARKLPIVIGSAEAQAIAVEIEKIPSRPFCHDLFKNLALSFHITLKEVVIYSLVDGIFYARLLCQQGKEMVEIDSRTSDAVALAVRFQCPIYTLDSILDTAGIILDNVEYDSLEDIEALETTEKDMELEILNMDLEELEEQLRGEFDSLSIEEIKKVLEEALLDEDYEKAARLRDELKERGEAS